MTNLIKTRNAILNMDLVERITRSNFDGRPGLLFKYGNRDYFVSYATDDTRDKMWAKLQTMYQPFDIQGDEG